MIGKLRPDEPVMRCVQTMEAILEGAMPRRHRLSREETAAWNADDTEQRDIARAAIREAVREQGGGEL